MIAQGGSAMNIAMNIRKVMGIVGFCFMCVFAGVVPTVIFVVACAIVQAIANWAYTKWFA
jgi:hypothetical protein